MQVTQWCEVALVVSDSSPTRLLCPWDSPGENIGVGCHVHLQGIFPTHLLCLLHDRCVQVEVGMEEERWKGFGSGEQHAEEVLCDDLCFRTKFMWFQ